MRRYNYLFLAAGNKKSQRANATESTRRISTGLTKHTARGFSVLYHVFTRKQCILCSALRHKSYLTLPWKLSCSLLGCRLACLASARWQQRNAFMVLIFTVNSYDRRRKVSGFIGRIEYTTTHYGFKSNRKVSTLDFGFEISGDLRKRDGFSQFMSRKLIKPNQKQT